MIDLFRSEFLRARSRRILPMMLVGGVLLIVVAMVIAGANSQKPTAAQIAAAQAFSQKQFNQCMRGQYGGQLPPGYDTLQELCTDETAPRTDTGLQFRDGALILEHTSTFVVLLGVALAASLGGADWSAGTMTTLLTWEPRRVRVLLVRAVVVALVVAFVTLLLQAILFGSFSLAVALRGTSLGAPSGLLGTAALTGIRVSTVAVGFGLVALAIATIGRSTVAALGVLFGYLVLVEGVIAGLRPSIQDRLLVRAGGVIVSQQPIYDESRSFSSIGPSNLPPVLLGITEAWVVAAVYVVVLMVLALVVFRTRDVN
ncbi:MAG TPA: ABC transporter permease subunit [Actinomycetota bacterium]|nr:ABC transporter permease subunit [Actinomycetota bacterium]